MPGTTSSTRHRASRPAELHRAAGQQKAELPALLRGPAALSTCPFCGKTDYMPLGSGWRRCWSCSERWGPTDVADPGDPTDLARIRLVLGTPAQRGRKGGAA